MKQIEFGYISSICPEAHMNEFASDFATAVGVANIIISDKFFDDS